MIKVTIYNEYCHERLEERIGLVHPKGIHGTLAEGLLAMDKDLQIRFATLDMPENGLTQEVIDDTDVLLWWGHMRHGDVLDAVADRVVKAVNEGMGFIPLHSAHMSKPFTRLMGTPCTLTWREIAENGRIWILDRTHPIMQGVGQYIDLPCEEMYGEPFCIPAPDELLGVTWWKGGEIFRGACTYHRGYGKIFYFHPGHESFASYRLPDVLRVIDNAIHWAKPVVRETLQAPDVLPVEKDIIDALYVEKDGKLSLKQAYSKPHVWKTESVGEK